MALELGEGMEQLFKHSNEFDQGMGKERKGAGEIVVSKDGTGDFDNILEAIKTIPDGGRISIKDGTYTIPSDGTQMIIPSNTILQGQGRGTIIRTPNMDYSSIITCANNHDILIRDIQFYMATTSCDGAIDIDNANKVSFEKCLFTFADSNSESCIWTSSGTTCSKFKLLNCDTDVTSGHPTSGFLGSVLTFASIQGNRLDGIDLFNPAGMMTDSIIKANFFRAFDVQDSSVRNVINANHCSDNITFAVGADNNTCIGNETDIAIVDGGAGNQVAHNVVF